MEAKDYMINDSKDKFKVFVIANKNYVNQWSTTSLENARESIRLFFKESSLPRSKAIIKDESFKDIEWIENK